MPRPLTRTLPLVLRKLEERDTGVRVVVARVNALPDSAHAELQMEDGTLVVVPRVSGAALVVGDAAYCLAARSLMLVIGTVK